MASLRDRTLVGVFWNLAEQLAVKGISVIVTLLLAYFLSPEDFGLVAMMTVFISIATSLMDSGFRQALIRLPDARQVDFNTAFYANITLGFVAYLLLFFAAPLISGFYGEERLTALIRVTGLVVILNSFQVVQYACLSRAMNFKIQFRAAFPASLISAFVAIYIAYAGFGVWALIAQMLVSAFLVAAFLWWQKLWRPSLSWSTDSLKSMYLFGYKLFISGMLDTGFKNMYVVVIAKLFTTSIAGLYFFADRIKEILIFQLVATIQKVTYPALSSIQTEPQRLKKAFKTVIRITVFILSPLILLFAALAGPIFELLLPERWWPAVIYVQLMCLAGVLIPIHAINLNLLKVLGRSDLFLRLEIIKKSIAIFILLCTYKYGVIGILTGQIMSSIVGYIPNSIYSKQLIGYSPREQVMDFLPPLFLASLVGLFVWWAQNELNWHSLPELVVLGSSGLIAYICLSWLMKIKGFGLAMNILNEKVRTKKLQ